MKNQLQFIQFYPIHGFIQPIALRKNKTVFGTKSEYRSWFLFSFYFVHPVARKKITITPLTGMGTRRFHLFRFSLVLLESPAEH